MSKHEMIQKIIAFYSRNSYGADVKRLADDCSHNRSLFYQYYETAEDAYIDACESIKIAETLTIEESNMIIRALQDEDVTGLKIMRSVFGMDERIGYVFSDCGGKNSEKRRYWLNKEDRANWKEKIRTAYLIAKPIDQLV